MERDKYPFFFTMKNEGLARIKLMWSCLKYAIMCLKLFWTVPVDGA